MNGRSNGAFTTRPGIAACALGEAGNARPLSDFADRDAVAAMLRDRGMAAEAAEGKAALFAGCAEALRASVDAASDAAPPAHAFFVPGRIELLGKHTDYCGGRSLLCAIERGFCFLAVSRKDVRVGLNDVATGERADFPLVPGLVPKAGHWTNYPMTVARRVATNFDGPLHGCDIAFASDLPQAAGLSSSSAFVVGSFLVFSAVNGLTASAAYRANIRSTEDLASYLGSCENGSDFGTLNGVAGVGTFGGSQDHTAILCCRPETLSVFGFCPVRHEADIRLADEIALHVCPTGVVAEKTGSAMAKYNAVSMRARKIVDSWNTRTDEQRRCLNDILVARPDALGRLRAILRADARADAEFELSSRLDQFLIESNRLIPAASRLIAAGAWDAVGRLVDESQALAESHLMNQVPETVDLQRQMRKAGAVAASAFGAGFGGSVWGMFTRPTAATAARG